MTIYNKNYSDYYDTLYKDKNYKLETDFIFKVLKKYSNKKSNNLLSLGCGTCNYELLLAGKGCKVTGIDRSKQMLDTATRKIRLAKLNSKVTVLEKDVRAFEFKNKFDNAMAMFNIVGYLTKNDDFEKMLKNIANSLKVGGLFIFDCWYMPAVLKDKPKDKIKKINIKGGQLVRLTKSKLDVNKNVIEIKFNVVEKSNERILAETKETHLVRYWSLPELEYFIKKAGLSIIKTCNFMDLNSEISENNWNMFVVARKHI